ncbi:MAG: hypothetical protein SFY69_06600 [Planctomycetota bacterium]|nr:hypothetical protein [Planctomycetota bacterium]
MNPRAAILICVTGAIFGLPAPGRTQPEFARPTRLDPGVGDVSPLQRSFRLEPIDLRLEPDFSTVYEVNTPSRLFAPEPRRMLARRAGATTALFPESSYVMGPDGRFVATIPADTTFLIGEPPPRPGTGDAAYDRRADLSAGHAAGAAAGTSPSHDRPTGAVPPASSGASITEIRGVSIWTDPDYRALRIAALLDAALHAPAERHESRPHP